MNRAAHHVIKRPLLTEKGTRLKDHGGAPVRSADQIRRVGLAGDGARQAIACGKHEVTFKRDDLGLTKTTTITLRDGETVKRSFVLQEETD